MIADDDSGKRTPATLPAQAVGSGIAAAGGFAVGGPIGAILSSMSAPYLIEMTRRSWEEIATARRENVVSLVAQASARLGVEAEELHEAAMSSPEGKSLFADSIQAAAETLDRRKVAGLAKALANGLLDDQAAVDENLTIVRALADLEASHVRLLGLLPSGSRGTTLTASKLALVAVLERNGLATDDAHERAVAAADDLSEEVGKALAEIGKALDGKSARIPNKLKKPRGTSTSRTRRKWRRTSFGTACLEHLYQAAIEVDLQPMDNVPDIDPDAEVQDD